MPFTTEKFLHVFELYNNAIWPGQVLAYALGLAVLVMAAYRRELLDRVVCAVLALAWLWMGIVYHAIYFGAINKAGYIFCALFVIQAVIFLLAGTARSGIAFRPRFNVHGAIGGLFILYAMLIYPLLGIALDHAYPRAPMFGVAPCPTVIFTLGLLLWTANGKLPRYVLVIPLIWSAIGFTAAISLGIREDIGLLVAGVVTLLLLMAAPKETPASEAGAAAQDAE